MKSASPVGNLFQSYARGSPAGIHSDALSTASASDLHDLSISSVPSPLRENNASPGQIDLEMPDSRPKRPIRGRSNVLETIEPQFSSGGTVDFYIPDTEMTARALVSHSTTPDEDIAVAESNHVGEDPLTWSLEVERRLKAESYDPSNLDAFIQKQAGSRKDDHPTPEDLLKTQIWGHVDPRESWPKTQSAEWLSEKRKEIEARGGRKVNFGKLLTAQVRKERKENGWSLHQNKEGIDDEKSDVAAIALQELFGIPDIDDLEPSVRDGQLAMKEKAVDREGKNRDHPKVYVAS